MDHATARALADAGYLPLPEYLRLCRENGWQSQLPERGRADFGALSEILSAKADSSVILALAAALR